MRALPQDLLCDRVSAGDNMADRALAVRQRVPPVSAEFEVGLATFDTTPRPGLRVDDVGREVPTPPLPIGGVEALHPVRRRLHKIGPGFSHHVLPLEWMIASLAQS